MGAAHFFHHDTRTLVSLYWGRTTPEETVAMRRARAADPDRASALAHVIDLTDFEGSTASPAAETSTFSSLGAEYASVYGPLRTVVIAPRAHVFGEARAFEIQATAGVPAAPVRAVLTWEEAERVLEMDLASVRDAIDARRTNSS